ncbi:MAG: Nif3-like dinuclear metal center hexameric protein [Firmicutes bacterium]|nr:Nif3-like dinuclear metal center hexameric protein [Bacillota bacterium]
MILRNDLYKALNAIAPLDTQEPWDNSGVQIETGKQEVGTILVALELNEAVAREAVSCNADIVITHHPLFFGEVTSLRTEDPTGRAAMMLIKAGISAYATHTPFDKADRGNNACLAQKLGLIECGGLTADDGKTELIGGVGKLSRAVPLGDFVRFVAKVLGIEACQIHAVGEEDMPVQIVGFCTGAGCDREAIDAAIDSGCDVFVTGDVKYHDARYAKDLGFALIDAGHYGTEYIFTENMAGLLREKLGTHVTVVESKVDLNPWM